MSFMKAWSSAVRRGCVDVPVTFTKAWSSAVRSPLGDVDVSTRGIGMVECCTQSFGGC
jgi:hypothetical protein